jgi:hypothetical protein
MEGTKTEKIVIMGAALMAVMTMFSIGQLVITQQSALSINGQSHQISIQGQGLGYMYTPCPPIRAGIPFRALLDFNASGTNGALTGSFETTNPLQDKPSPGNITKGTIILSAGATIPYILYGTLEVPVCGFAPDVTITGYCGIGVPIRFIAGSGHVVTITKGNVTCNNSKTAGM